MKVDPKSSEKTVHYWFVSYAEVSADRIENIKVCKLKTSTDWMPHAKLTQALSYRSEVTSEFDTDARIFNFFEITREQYDNIEYNSIIDMT